LLAPFILINLMAAIDVSLIADLETDGGGATAWTAAPSCYILSAVKVRVHVFLLVFVVCAVVSCGEKSPTAPTPSADRLSRLSGDWTGFLVIKQAGTCTTDSSPLPVVMTWTASDLGQLTISERPPYGTNWGGTVTPDLKVSVTKTALAQCANGPTSSYESVYSGVIQGSSPIRLELQGVETPCPPNCVFQVVYSLTKQ
jgi:hypothetical protein